MTEVKLKESEIAGSAYFLGILLWVRRTGLSIFTNKTREIVVRFRSRVSQNERSKEHKNEGQTILAFPKIS